jgi:hypothetical protein
MKGKRLNLRNFASEFLFVLNHVRLAEVFTLRQALIPSHLMYTVVAYLLTGRITRRVHVNYLPNEH